MCISSTTTNTVARKKEISDRERRVRQTTDSLVQNQTSATEQEQAFQDETIDLLVTVSKYGVA